MLGIGLSDQALAAIASARRAAAVERMAALDVAVEMRPLATLATVIEPWQALAARTLEANVFYEPAFALAAAPVLGADVQVGLVWSQAPKRELLGLFPVRRQSRRYGLPLPILSGWTHPFAPFGTPLVHRDFAEQVIGAWFSHLAHDPAMPALLLMPYLADDGAFAAVMDAVLRRHGNASAVYNRHCRALFAPNGDRANYLAHSMAAKRRRELARQRRRLGEIGKVTVDRAHGTTAAAELVDFLRIEASGWKGRARSAAASNDAVCRFVSQSFAGLEKLDQAAVYRLLLDGTGDRRHHHIAQRCQRLVLEDRL